MSSRGKKKKQAKITRELEENKRHQTSQSLNALMEYAKEHPEVLERIKNEQI